MNLLHRILSAFLFGIIRLAGHLPLGFLYFKAVFLQFIAEKVFMYRKEVILQNLSKAFPEKNQKEILTISHQFYRHFFSVFTEVIKSQGMSPEEARKHFQLQNPELINDFHKQGVNVIVMGGHWGNWEWIILSPLFFNFSTYTLYKPLSSIVAENLMSRVRSRFGLKLLPMQQAGRFILSKQDYPALYYFIGDQSPSHKDPEYCFNFLNQPSFFFTGGAKLALATQSAVVYQSIIKNKPGYYSVKYQTISQPGDGKKVKDILNEYAGLLERDIREQPENWLWSHRRWKNKPLQPV